MCIQEVMGTVGAWVQCAQAVRVYVFLKYFSFEWYINTVMQVCVCVHVCVSVGLRWLVGRPLVSGKC